MNLSLDDDDDDELELNLDDDDDDELELNLDDDDDELELNLDDDDDDELELNLDDDDNEKQREILKNKLIDAKDELKEYWNSNPKIQKVIETNFYIFADLLDDHEFDDLYEKLSPSFEQEEAYLRNAKSSKDIQLLRDACFNFSLNHTCCLTIEQILRDKKVSSFVNGRLEELVEKYNEFEDVYKISEGKKERRNATVKKGIKTAAKIIGGIAISPLLVAGALLGNSDDSGSSTYSHSDRSRKIKYYAYCKRCGDKSWGTYDTPREAITDLQNSYNRSERGCGNNCHDPDIEEVSRNSKIKYRAYCKQCGDKSWGTYYTKYEAVSDLQNSYNRSERGCGKNGHDPLFEEV